MNKFIPYVFYAFLLGSFYPSTGLADPFEEWLAENERRADLQTYRAGKLAWETATDETLKDRAARKIFTGLALWFNAQQFNIFKKQVQTQKAPVPVSVTQGLQPAQQKMALARYQSLKQAELLAFVRKTQEGMKRAVAQSKVWFTRRSRSDASEGDHTNTAIKLWIKAATTELCARRFQKIYWSTHPGVPGELPPVTYSMPLTKFKQHPEAPLPFITNPLALETIAQKGHITYQGLAKLCIDTKAKFTALWNRSLDSEETFVPDNYAQIMFGQERYHEADDELYDKILHLAIDAFHRKIGVDVVWFPGTAVQTSPSLQDIIGKIRTLFALHVTLGGSEELPPEHENSFARFLAALDVLGKRQQARLFHIAMKTSGMEGLQSRVDLDKIEDHIKRVWFMTSPEILRQPLTREMAQTGTTRQRHVAEQLHQFLEEEIDEALQTSEKSEAQLRQEMTPEMIASLIMMKIALNKESKLYEKGETEALWMEALWMVWSERPVSASFETEDPDETLSRQWEDRRLYFAYIKAKLNQESAISAILWEKPWDLWLSLTRLLRLPNFDEDPSLQQRARSIWREHTPEGIDFSSTYMRLCKRAARVNHINGEVRVLLDQRQKLLQDVASNQLKLEDSVAALNKFRRQIAHEERQMEHTWQWTRPLPPAIQGIEKAESADSQAALWSQCLALALVHHDIFYQMYVVNEGAKHLEISTMLAYQGEVQEAGDLAAQIRATMRKLFGVWRNRQGEATLKPTECPLETHRRIWASWTELKKWLNLVYAVKEHYTQATAFLAQQPEPTEIPSFEDVFALEGDAGKTLQIPMGNARAVWNAPLAETGQ